jgi:hypothetical protein
MFRRLLVIIAMYGCFVGFLISPQNPLWYLAIGVLLAIAVFLPAIESDSDLTGEKSKKQLTWKNSPITYFLPLGILVIIGFFFIKS